MIQTYTRRVTKELTGIPFDGTNLDEIVNFIESSLGELKESRLVCVEYYTLTKTFPSREIVAKIKLKGKPDTLVLETNKVVLFDRNQPDNCFKILTNELLNKHYEIN